ncbi:MAG: hypothetical protein RJB66_1926 [Pseudomonadota bacterium]
MDICEVCGNQYEKPIEIKMANESITHHFDSFECAIHQLAPRCQACGVRVLGHGVEVANSIFCGAHCARLKGYSHLVDHVDVELALGN